MKSILKVVLFTILCTSQIIYSQTEDETSKALEIANQIIIALESTDAINNLILNRNIVNGQLESISNWSRENKISPATYTLLENSYTSYSDHMNNVLEHLKADLRSIHSFRQLKGARLDRFITKFQKVYTKDLNAANYSYNTVFVPAFETAAQESEYQSKSIIPALLFILKYGSTIYNTISDLLSGGKLGPAAEELILRLGVDFTIKKLENKLHYQAWDEIVLNSSSGVSGRALNQAEIMENRIQNLNNNKIETAPSYRITEGFIELAYFETHENIPLLMSSKDINVGTSKSIKIPSYATVNPMKNGDRFWVKINGYEYVNFFAYQSSTDSWQDPFGKDIGTGTKENDVAGETILLPAENSFFDINSKGNSKIEQFLIIISNFPMPDDRRNVIIGKEQGGVKFLNDLADYLPNIRKPWDEDNTPDSNTLSKIPLNQSDSEQIYIPIYIRIDKE